MRERWSENQYNGNSLAAVFQDWDGDGNAQAFTSKTHIMTLGKLTILTSCLRPNTEGGDALTSSLRNCLSSFHRPLDQLTSGGSSLQAQSLCKLCCSWALGKQRGVEQGDEHSYGQTAFLLIRPAGSSWGHLKGITYQQIFKGFNVLSKVHVRTTYSKLHLL